MILLKKVRLINWYGFGDETFPVGKCTLIAGKNGNGKSVLLDALKYALFGDTVFNRSSESKGSRTIPSYTRGFLDVTHGTCMRDPSQYPMVYSHIAMEFYDEMEEKPFVLGAVIETNSANGHMTYRYAADKKRLEDIELTWKDENGVYPKSMAELRDASRLTMMNREQGIALFLQYTGLRLSMSQLPTYLRKLRSIMSYDPDARIDRFIRESVLEERNVDLNKLFDARKQVEALQELFLSINQEIGDLDQILSGYDQVEEVTFQVTTEEIKGIYAKSLDLKEEIERLSGERELSQAQKEEYSVKIHFLGEKTQELDADLARAKQTLQTMDIARLIEEEKQRLGELKKREQELQDQLEGLGLFEEKIKELLPLIEQEGGSVRDRAPLLSLRKTTYTRAAKSFAVEELREKLEESILHKAMELERIEQKIQEINEKILRQEKLKTESERRENVYSLIPDCTGLRDAINRALASRGLPNRACLACEYVVSLRDETCRDALESYLGDNRYAILVDPEVFEIAYEVQKKSPFQSAKLFNTGLLAKKQIKAGQDSAAELLEIQNPLAKSYFDFLLGDVQITKAWDVKAYEDALARSGYASSKMLLTFLPTKELPFYYLGEKARELNRKRAQKAIEALQEEKETLFQARKDLQQVKGRLSIYRGFFKDYSYDAPENMTAVQGEILESQKRIAGYEESLASNEEYRLLLEQISDLEKRSRAFRAERDEAIEKSAHLDAQILAKSEVIARDQNNEEEVRERLLAIEREQYSAFVKAKTSYDAYLDAGKKGEGGLLTQIQRDVLREKSEKLKNHLIFLQSSYCAAKKTADLPVGVKQGRELYASRREKIWMDDREQAQKQLKEQTALYENIFKNEFVLSVLKSCEKAKADLYDINKELGRLHFPARYQFDVHELKDDSDYATILRYARFIEEREQMGGNTPGQMTLSFTGVTTIPDEEGPELENKMRQIIGRMLGQGEEATLRYSDYRNYMTYEILISNKVLDRARLSRQSGFNSGAEVQIPYLLILTAALLMIYRQKSNSTRFVFIDEPFAKMDPGNVKEMLSFMKEQNLQVILCSPDKIETIGNECDVILPVLRIGNSMQVGTMEMHGESDI